MDIALGLISYMLLDNNNLTGGMRKRGRAKLEVRAKLEEVRANIRMRQLAQEALPLVETNNDMRKPRRVRFGSESW